DMQRAIKRMFADHAGQSDAPVRHFVVASRLPGIFNMGGDLAFFADRIRAQDRQALLTYAHACIEVVYNNATALDLPMITMALVQGDALGGGFEAALSCDLIVAERSAKMGLPEILFNLFPGMGAYSLLSRKLDPARAERMILSGRIYGAAELYEMGLVDVVAEDGQGEEAVRHYIARNARRHGVQRCLSEMRRRINPLTFAELQDVTEMWVETALRLEEIDLRKMERLMPARRRRGASGVNGAALAVGPYPETSFSPSPGFGGVAGMLGATSHSTDSTACRLATCSFRARQTASISSPSFLTCSAPSVVSFPAPLCPHARPLSS